MISAHGPAMRVDQTSVPAFRPMEAVHVGCGDIWETERSACSLATFCRDKSDAHVLDDHGRMLDDHRPGRRR